MIFKNPDTFPHVDLTESWQGVCGMKGWEADDKSDFAHSDRPKCLVNVGHEMVFKLLLAWGGLLF